MGRHRPRGPLPVPASKKDLRAEASRALAGALQDDNVTNALRVVLRRVALPTAALLLDAVLRPPPDAAAPKELGEQDAFKLLDEPTPDCAFAVGDEIRGEDWPDWGPVRAIVDDTLIVAQPREDGEPTRIVVVPFALARSSSFEHRSAASRAAPGG